MADLCQHMETLVTELANNVNDKLLALEVGSHPDNFGQF